MKYQLLTLFLAFNVCYGQDSTFVVNNQTVPIVDFPPGPPLPPGSNSTTEPATITTQAPNVTTTTLPTTVAPNVTTTPSTTTVKPSTSTPVPTPPTSKPTSTTSSTEKPTPTTPVTTPKPTTGKPTAKPSSTETPATTAAPAANNRKFDGPSFVGGIVLASGLMAIGFVAFKFYKARTELNYHTL